MLNTITAALRIFRRPLYLPFEGIGSIEPRTQQREALAAIR